MMDDETFAAERKQDAQEITDYCKKYLKNHDRINLSQAINKTVKRKYSEWKYRDVIIKLVVYELRKTEQYRLEAIKNINGITTDYMIYMESLERLPAENPINQPNKPAINTKKSIIKNIGLYISKDGLRTGLFLLILTFAITVILHSKGCM